MSIDDLFRQAIAMRLASLKEKQVIDQERLNKVLEQNRLNRFGMAGTMFTNALSYAASGSSKPYYEKPLELPTDLNAYKAFPYEPVDVSDYLVKYGYAKATEEASKRKLTAKLKGGELNKNLLYRANKDLKDDFDKTFKTYDKYIGGLKTIKQALAHNNYLVALALTARFVKTLSQDSGNVSEKEQDLAIFKSALKNIQRGVRKYLPENISNMLDKKPNESWDDYINRVEKIQKSIERKQIKIPNETINQLYQELSAAAVSMSYATRKVLDRKYKLHSAMSFYKATPEGQILYGDIKKMYDDMKKMTDEVAMKNATPALTIITSKYDSVPNKKQIKEFLNNYILKNKLNKNKEKQKAVKNKLRKVFFGGETTDTNTTEQTNEQNNLTQQSMSGEYMKPNTTSTEYKISRINKIWESVK